MTDLAWEAEGDGPPDLLLLHPGLSDRTFWDLAWPGLVRLGRAIRFDARGFGDSPDPTADWSPAEDALAVLDAAGSERAIVIGVSFGSWTALHLAADHPDRVAALVLVSGPGGSDDAEEAALGPVDDAIERGDLDAANAMEIDHWAGRADPDVREWVLAQNRALLERQSPIPYSASLGDAEHEEVAARLRMPVRLLLGEHDTSATVLGAQAVCQVVGGEVEVVPRAGHLLGREEPEAFLAAVEPLVRAAAPSA